MHEKDRNTNGDITIVMGHQGQLPNSQYHPVSRGRAREAIEMKRGSGSRVEPREQRRQNEKREPRANRTGRKLYIQETRNYWTLK